MISCGDRPLAGRIVAASKKFSNAKLNVLAVARTARAVVLMGKDAALIEQALTPSGVPLLRVDSMDAAVTLAAQHARPGDRVLLSPACASFDMFSDFEERGRVFIDTVRRSIS